MRVFLVSQMHFDLKACRLFSMRIKFPGTYLIARTVHEQFFFHSLLFLVLLLFVLFCINFINNKIVEYIKIMKLSKRKMRKSSNKYVIQEKNSENRNFSALV